MSCEESTKGIRLGLPLAESAIDHGEACFWSEDP